jgi:hypothetical protein
MFILPVSQHAGLLADAILVTHFAWAAWMVSGFVLAVLGFKWIRLWRWRVFRISHLIGLAATATTPFWAGGICPMTEWEWYLGTAERSGSAPSESFIIHWINEILYLDVDPLTLSLVTGAVALTTLIIFILRPPWRSYA